jgi:hypothetical protein
MIALMPVGLCVCVGVSTKKYEIMSTHRDMETCVSL